MALNLRASSLSSPSSYSTSTLFLIPKHNKHFYVSKLYSFSSSPSKIFAQTENTQTDQQSPSSTSGPSSSNARARLDLLEQLTSGYESDAGGGGAGGSTWNNKLTIREQLAQLVGDRDGEFSVALGQKNLKKISAKFLTTSQKRNIKRQAYMDEVSQRNDSVFFATVGAFVILPPIVILGIAILTGYVQLFP